MSGSVNVFDLIKEGQKLVIVRCKVLMTEEVFGKIRLVKMLLCAIPR